MQDQSFDPTEPKPDKLNVETTGAEPLVDEIDISDLKLEIAERVRFDSKERGQLTEKRAIEKLSDGLPPERLGPLLAEMSGEGQFGDIKAIVTPSGRIYLFSEKHLITVEAQQKGRLEEAKFTVADKIRADSGKIVLTPRTEIDALLAWAEPPERESILASIEDDERFKDIQKMTGSKGEVYYYSMNYLSGRYALVMMRAKHAAPAFGIAEFVREQSRIQPLPTRMEQFQDSVFGIETDQLDALIEEMLKSPEYADIKKMTHRETGAVYLYSNKWLTEQRAFEIIDWEEVGKIKRQ